LGVKSIYGSTDEQTDLRKQDARKTAET